MALEELIDFFMPPRKTKAALDIWKLEHDCQRGLDVFRSGLALTAAPWSSPIKHKLFLVH